MKMIKTISILTLCLAATLAFGAELVPGEMSLSQASETSGGWCVEIRIPDCPVSCPAGAMAGCGIADDEGSCICLTGGSSACGSCNLTNQAATIADCP